MNSKETIFQATLELASEKGLGNVSLSQIAKKVGIQKPSLYSHFRSKEELIDGLYQYLRESASKVNGNASVDYGKLVEGQNAYDVLIRAVESYSRINADKNMRMFYRFIMSERVFNKEAAKIMVTETEKMVLATKQLFYAMQVHKVMEFDNVDMAATLFAMAVHSLLDYQIDKEFTESADTSQQVAAFIDYFCKKYEVNLK
ncbi:TetR/AcrR family transcriptional regulator [Blautia schinkii]|nr:TetR/AcrR family transcriptional regulator [Blautia schinkii]